MAYSLLIAIVIALGGCSHITMPVTAPPDPLYYVQPETWQAINEQILSASVNAKQKSKAYAEITMADWLQRVRKQTEDVFIPWYSSFWTQQWLSSRVALYQFEHTEGENPPDEQLARYLEQQFYEQVLEPVSKSVDPQTVMKEMTAIYIRELKKNLDRLPLEHQIPAAAFNQHLKHIPAIIVQVKLPQDASLYEVLNTNELSDLSAYKTLLTQISANNHGIGTKQSEASLDRAAKRAVTELMEQMKLRGGASVTSFIVGGLGGVLISVGTLTWSYSEHEQDKPEMVTQLRSNLNSMLETIWQDLMKDSRSGVTAIVWHMSTQIEYAVFTFETDGSELF